jgi:hypothetical protein
VHLRQLRVRQAHHRRAIDLQHLMVKINLLMQKPNDLLILLAFLNVVFVLCVLAAEVQNRLDLLESHVVPRPLEMVLKNLLLGGVRVEEPSLLHPELKITI